jgi:hypothetical protein
MPELRGDRRKPAPFCRPATFLEFVVRRYLGEPTGVSCPCWPCPACSHPTRSLTVNPPKDGCKDKFRCFRCLAWGDEFDIVKWSGVRDYGDRLGIVRQLRAEYDAMADRKPAQRSAGRRVVVSSSSPTGSKGSDEADRLAVEAAIMVLSKADLFALACGEPVDLPDVALDYFDRPEEAAGLIAAYWREFIGLTA